MRIWHKEMIHVLPDNILARQWKDCCEIARRIAVQGTPKEALVNRIMDYPIEHFWAYARLVIFEMLQRGTYACDWYEFGKWCDAMGSFPEKIEVTFDDIFHDWHTDHYFWQCYHNLEEQYDCGLIRDDDWEAMCDEFCLKL